MDAKGHRHVQDQNAIAVADEVEIVAQVVPNIEGDA
jgi:hypothetical protein